MFKKSNPIFSLAAFLLIICSIPAQAADDTEIKLNGDFRARYENFQNPTAVYNASDSEGHANHRFKLNTAVRKGENLNAFLTLIHGAEWGSHTGDAVSSINSKGTGNTDDGTKDGINDTQNMILVNRAWANWRSSNLLSFKVGRVGLELGDGTVFSENDWERTPTSHDGILSQWEVAFGRFDFFAIKTHEYGQGFVNHDAERNLYGVSLSVKSIPQWIKILNLNFIQVVKDETGTGASSSPAYLDGAKVNEQRVDLTLSGDTGRLFYRLSGAYVFGLGKTNSLNLERTLNISEYMVDSSVGMNWNSSQSFKSFLNFHADSGTKDLSTDQAHGYESMYYDIHRYGGFMDIVRWGNLTSTNLALAYNPAEDIEIGLGYFYFTRSVTSDASTAAGATASPTNFGPEYKTLSAASSLTELGHELDLTLIKSFDNGLKFTTAINGFLPGAAIRDSNTPKKDRIIYEYFAEASINF